MNSYKPLGFYITGYGMASCFGNADNSCAAIRAGLNGFKESDFVLPMPGEIEPQKVKMCPVSYVAGAEDYGRLLLLIIPALAQAIIDAELSSEQLKQTEFVFILPDPAIRYVLDDIWDIDKEFPEGVFQFFFNGIKDHLKLDLTKKQIKFMEGSYNAYLKTLYHLDNEVQRVVICSVDSCIEDANVEILMKYNKVKLDTNSSGLIPGEAASVVVLDKNNTTNNLHQPFLNGVAFKKTENTAQTEDDIKMVFNIISNTATEVLSDLVQNENLAHSELDILTDSNGEQARAKQWANSLLNIMSNYDCQLKMHSVAESVGDVGASVGVLNTIQALRMFDRDYARSNAIIVSSIDDIGDAGALLITK